MYDVYNIKINQMYQATSKLYITSITYHASMVFLLFLFAFKFVIFSNLRTFSVKQQMIFVHIKSHNIPVSLFLDNRIHLPWLFGLCQIKTYTKDYCPHVALSYAFRVKVTPISFTLQLWNIRLYRNVSIWVTFYVRIFIKD